MIVYIVYIIGSRSFGGQPVATWAFSTREKAEKFQGEQEQNKISADDVIEIFEFDVDVT